MPGPRLNQQRQKCRSTAHPARARVSAAGEHDHTTPRQDHPSIFLCGASQEECPSSHAILPTNHPPYYVMASVSLSR
jgi:hypothetical protein